MACIRSPIYPRHRVREPSLSNKTASCELLATEFNCPLYVCSRRSSYEIALKFPPNLHKYLATKRDGFDSPINSPRILTGIACNVFLKLFQAVCTFSKNKAPYVWHIFFLSNSFLFFFFFFANDLTYMRITKK